jgi:hypothetical protein
MITLSDCSRAVGGTLGLDRNDRSQRDEREGQPREFLARRQGSVFRGPRIKTAFGTDILFSASLCSMSWGTAGQSP